MAENSSFMLNLSILYRNTQKYYDHVLAQYDMGSGQLIFLLYINEHKGVTMQDVTNATQVDKGTTTKSIQRLIDQGYIQARQDENDKRVKRLYTTDKAADIMNDIYEYRNKCRTVLADGTDFSVFEILLDKVAHNSSEKLNPEESVSDFSGLRIGGLQKMTLLDYPDKVASTVFTAGCNFKCPFCHNRDLVFLPEDYEYYDPEEIMAYLEKRKGLIDGVCISGGEPMLQDTLEFMKRIKKMGYLVKLDTNGSRPEKLQEYVESGYIDYVAMDIKNCKEKYAETVGMDAESFSIENIEKSVDFLKKGTVDYEFRTTVVRELHTKEDLIALAKWIAPTKKYYLQQFMDSGNLIQEGCYTAYDAEEMKELRDAVREILPDAQCRGLKEN
jgi:anaerobic ribonucleoside-triphosphate reductase activating protein